jgi:cyclopropane fatty-acyl-phospholipid synthase-like methyltransferase
MDIKNHWETIYQTKQPNEVSWTQEIPKTSLSFIHGYKLSKSSKIIDIGGGDSKLVDYLLDEGFEDITVLDISANALNKAKERLGTKADRVNWIVADVNSFKPDKKYDVWHDRATFHFLTTRDQVNHYLDIAEKAIQGYMLIATFSERGPKKCSGLEIKQYSEPELQKQLSHGFKKIRCITEDHITPFETTQNFLFCSFHRKENLKN